MPIGAVSDTNSKILGLIGASSHLVSAKNITLATRMSQSRGHYAIKETNGHTL